MYTALKHRQSEIAAGRRRLSSIGITCRRPPLHTNEEIGETRCPTVVYPLHSPKAPGEINASKPTLASTVPDHARCGVKLPGGFKPDTHLVGAWDAGTEQNNQLFSQIVDPCQMAGPVSAPTPDGNGRVATNGVIETHPNITPGVGDLTAAHRWQFPVARITVQRLK